MANKKKRGHGYPKKLTVNKILKSFLDGLRNGIRDKEAF